METYCEEDCYNADETGMQWRALPNTSIVFKEEKEVRGFKICKERVTLMVCSNATGSHKIPMMVIGKSQKPRCFGKKIPDNYYANKTAWMSSELFIRWYEDIFIPAVEDHQRRNGRVKPVILLLDNAPVHPRADSLERNGGRFRVRYLPPNVTALIQPMDQTVIATLKANYRRLILRQLIHSDDEAPITRQMFLKSYTLKEAIMNIKLAWASVKESTLKNAWNKLRGGEQPEEEILMEYEEEE